MLEAEARQRQEAEALLGHAQKFGSHWSTDRRRRTRLQQFAHGNRRQPGNGENERSRNGMKALASGSDEQSNTLTMVPSALVTAQIVASWMMSRSADT
jgi:hypothetical protein